MLAFQRMVRTLGEEPIGVEYPGLHGRAHTQEDWENVNLLASMVERQANFITKMGDHMWFRSPALDGTLSRALVRYESFMRLFKQHPRSTLVPTLDIDLVWHTHQCSPNQYWTSSMTLAGRVINHNDELDKSTLRCGFKETARFYEMRFKDEYNTCLCWNCQALMSKFEEDTLNADVDFDVVAKEIQDEVTYYKAVEFARRSPKKALLPVR